MKKILIILLLIVGITYTSCLTTYAQTTNFYEGEYIEGIWMNKYNPSNNTIYYQKARFFRQTNTNEFAYCIEPFSFFNETSQYESTINPYNLSSEQLNRISQIAHFGYNYKNHNDPKWYAITQFMIWQVSDPTGDYYFTDSLNGNRINPYINEINEINSLINSYNTIPSFSNQTFYKVKDNNLILEDTNNVINNYTYSDSSIIKEDNKLIINYNEPKEYNITLTRQDNYYNKPIIFFQSAQSQNLVETGDINNINVNLKIIVQETTVIINKLDAENNSTKPSGDASLDGAIYGIYDSNYKLIKELTIKDNKANIDNLDYGKYYIKEIEAGEGYLLDKEVYSFEITKDNPTINLELKNLVIKSKFIIKKKYGEEDNLQDEKDISFNIYNSKKELIDTITTDINGIATITLPYGKYTLEQINTTEGYQKSNPLDFIIDSGEEKEITIRDLKIKVPNTHSNKHSIFLIIVLFIKSLIC